MNGKTAAFIFLGICLILGVLLLTQVISPVISSLLFAAALAALGIASRGFRK